MARSMIKAKDLPTQLWAEVVTTAVYLFNMSLIRAILNKTPSEAWFDKNPWMNHLKVFGCIAYALVKTHSLKLDDKSKKYIFVSYCSQLAKPYKLYNPISGKTIIGRDVVFNKDASWALSEDKS